jgi:hypothetical protein
MGLLLHLTILVCSLAFPSYFLFPLGVVYLTFGLLRHAVLGFLDRADAPLAVVAEDAHEELEEVRRTAPRMTSVRRGSEE